MVMPCLVHIDRVRAHAYDLSVLLVEQLVCVRELLELGRADEREVSRIESEDQPPAPVIGQLDLLYLVVLIDLELEIRYCLTYLQDVPTS
jgi:hypothetical protein